MDSTFSNDITSSNPQTNPSTDSQHTASPSANEITSPDCQIIPNPDQSLEMQKAEVIKDVLNFVVRMKGFENRMKTILQEMKQSIDEDKQEKERVQQYVNRFRGSDADLCKRFVIEDLQRDFLHQVKIKNALAIVEDSLDLKTECFDRFSKA